MLVTTHSPFFVSELRQDELWILYRDGDGFTQARRASEMRGINEMMEAGAKLGQLWMEGFFEAGDPLINAGRPRNNGASSKV